MSRFSIVNVMGRRSTVSSDGSERPSIISTLDLNRQLNEEAKRVDQHLFFGPQQAVFEGGDRTRVIHGERKIQKNSKRFWLVSEPLSMDRDSTTSLIGFPTEPPPKKGLESVTSSISAAGRYIGQKVAQMKFPPSHVNEDSFCDGCGMDPIVGNMYSCSKCDNYSLCESCYQSGIHGFEDSELLKDVREDYALRNVMETCRHKVPEKVFHLLLKTVCRGQVDKFNFLATWICSVVLAHPIHELSVRGIEIPHLDQETRATLVTLLTPVLAERNDLEVCMEWFCPQADNENVPNSKRREETLRIWVATDKDSKSPFAVTKDPARDADTESDLSPTSGSNGPASPSMSAGGEPESPEGTPPSSPMHYSAGNGEASFASSPPASPTQHAQLMVNALSLANDESNLAAGDASDDGESDSVKSDIAPRKVDGVSKSGQPSEGIEM